MSKKLREWRGQNANPAFVKSTHKAIRAWKLFLLHHHCKMPSMETRANSRQNLARNNSCTNANYIWAKCSGNGKVKIAKSAFVQSTQKAIRAWKLFLLHHRCKMPSMEIRANSRQTLARNNSCTNANCIWARTCGIGEAKNANPALYNQRTKRYEVANCSSCTIAT